MKKIDFQELDDNDEPVSRVDLSCVESRKTRFHEISRINFKSGFGIVLNELRNLF